MKDQAQKTIISGLATRRGDAAALLVAMRERVRQIGGARRERELTRLIERAHGLVVEAAEEINLAREVSEEQLRKLDVALVGYQRRVLMLCMNSKRRG
jgi:shikimate kinase